MHMMKGPEHRGEFDEWPLSHMAITGGMLLLLFLE